MSPHHRVAVGQRGDGADQSLIRPSDRGPTEDRLTTWHRQTIGRGTGPSSPSLHRCSSETPPAGQTHLHSGGLGGGGARGRRGGRRSFTRARYQLLDSSTLSTLQTFPSSSSFSLRRSSSSSSLDEDSLSSSALAQRQVNHG